MIDMLNDSKHGLLGYERQENILAWFNFGMIIQFSQLKQMYQVFISLCNKLLYLHYITVTRSVQRVMVFSIQGKLSSENQQLQMRV